MLWHEMDHHLNSLRTNLVEKASVRNSLCNKEDEWQQLCQFGDMNENRATQSKQINIEFIQYRILTGDRSLPH
jgi:hypothetical protein